jgi:hypothetical protein
VTTGATVQVEARAHALADAFRFCEILQADVEECALVVREIGERRACCCSAAAHARIHLRVRSRSQCGRSQAGPHGSPQQVMSFHMQTPFRVCSMLVCR